MPMRFEEGRRYRMPVVFGPSVSPRQMPDGSPSNMTTARASVAGVRFLTDEKRLDRLLPPGFTLDGEPVVTVEFLYYTNLEWLAGRGYNIVKVNYPARFQGKRDTARGQFLAVLWENRTDCCTTGREELGYAKIFADIFPPAVAKGEQRYLATADGHPIVRMSLHDIVETKPPAAEAIDGILHYYYVPKIGEPGKAEVEQAVISPTAPNFPKINKFFSARGDVDFPRASFEQLPTQFMIINALADLPKLESRGGYLIEMDGGRNYVEQRVLY
jgi:hypothetical protein